MAAKHTHGKAEIGTRCSVLGCNATNSRVLETRADEVRIVRRRQCNGTTPHRFNTVEIREPAYAQAAEALRIVNNARLRGMHDLLADLAQEVL